MARERTKDELLDQAVYALASVKYHYGCAYNPEGLKWLREQLAPIVEEWGHDSNWRVDTWEGAGEPNPDFCPNALEDTKTGLKFDEVARWSRTGKYDGDK